jgi:hypothetical protein
MVWYLDLEQKRLAKIVQELGKIRILKRYTLNKYVSMLLMEVNLGSKMVIKLCNGDTHGFDTNIIRAI